MSLYYLSFDDTDNLETIGTGHILAGFLQEYCEANQEKGLVATYITRHQLFVNPAVPYTSHNSAMCTTLEGGVCENDLIAAASAYLERVAAPGSDPGLCVADAATLTNPAALTLWGQRALAEVLTKQEAYDLAKQCNVHLSEHGGDGQGVVGALAAVGLRLDGNHGRVRGKRYIDQGLISANQLLKTSGFDCIRVFDKGKIGEELPSSALVYAESGVAKAIYRNFRSTLLASPNEDGTYTLLEKQQLKAF